MPLHVTHIENKPDVEHTDLMAESARLMAVVWRERRDDQCIIAGSQEAIHQSRCNLVMADRALKNNAWISD